MQHMDNKEDLATLTITPRKTWLPLPHYILVNGQLLGILKKGTVTLSLPEGSYSVTVRSMYKFIESSVTMEVTRGTVKRLTSMAARTSIPSRSTSVPTRARPTMPRCCGRSPYAYMA